MKTTLRSGRSVIECCKRSAPRAAAWLALGSLLAACDAPTEGRADGASPGSAVAAPRPFEEHSRLEPGTQRFTFSGWAGPELPFWLHIPAAAETASAPIVMVMHGAARDAGRYVRQWAPHAEAHGVIVIAPQFTKAAFPGALRYNLGHVFDESGSEREEALWSFSAIEPLFDAVRSALGNASVDYAMYGHSAGSQFVHRFLYYKPSARVSRYVAANAGWYTFPDPDAAYPYGLLKSGIGVEKLKSALEKDVVVLLGGRDNDPDHRSLRRTAEALEQGPHRLARGTRFFTAAEEVAQANGWPFGWRLQVVEGVAHSNRGMAEAAVALVR